MPVQLLNEIRQRKCPTHRNPSFDLSAQPKTRNRRRRPRRPAPAGGARRRCGHGEPYTKCIRINRDWPNLKKLINVMAHEMVHQWEWEKMGTMAHGAAFWSWQERLGNRGLKLYLAM